jgi:hypothetical protein
VPDSVTNAAKRHLLPDVQLAISLGVNHR